VLAVELCWLVQPICNCLIDAHLALVVVWVHTTRGGSTSVSCRIAVDDFHWRQQSPLPTQLLTDHLTWYRLLEEPWRVNLLLLATLSVHRSQAWTVRIASANSIYDSKIWIQLQCIKLR
jgi:hypothetical protein